MSSNYLLKNANIVNEGSVFISDLHIKNGRIEKISSEINIQEKCELIDLEGKLLLPGCIDDQVHFREPGLTNKADISTESYAAIAGGITSYMEMPNTIPNTLTQELLQNKYEIAKKKIVCELFFLHGS